MANLSHSESRRMYSWWWDSHISPKNSKWLQENLTDMDAKVKIMIKLIEEDADSFARRAEMYFKKRPELMKLVEEFYRAYRALAERYDHATGALRQAHRTMAEAFPNQVPFLLADDLPSGFFASEVQPHTPEKQHPVRAMLDPDDLHKDSVGLSSSHLQAIKRNGATADETDSVTSKTGLKQLNELFGSVEGVPQYVKFAHGRMRKGMNYHEEDRNDSKREMHIGARDQSNQMMKQGSQVGIFNQNLKTQIKSSSEQARKVEAEVQNLKYSLEEMEAEKEACLLQYQHALERLSSLEAEVSRSEEDSRRLNERASKAETEVRTLNEALIKLQAEKEGDLLQYQQCVERISDVEKKISNAQEDAKFDEKTISGETDPQSLKQAFIRVKAEKEASLFQYTHCLEKICYLETKVSVAEDNARSLNERAVRAETELQFLKETIAKLNEEKEAAALQYQRSLETISTLQSEVSHAQDEATRLSSVMVMGLAKLSSMEEQYIQLERENQSLQTEIDTLVQMMTIQKQELSEKQEELEGLQDFIEEEKFRSMETEDAFEALQNLHSECKEERGALVLEVQDGAQQFNEMELEYQSSEEETWHVKEGNPIMNEKNLSSFTAEKSLPDEIFRAREAGVKLDKEVEVLVDQRSALQQEIFYLKEEIDDLRKQHVNVTEEMELVGLKPDCFASSVKSLQDENSKLKEICQKQNSEKESLSKKLKDMENIFENNAVLENSFSDVNIGLESLREKIKALEESCRSLKLVYSAVVDEKESLISLMEMANRNAEKLSQKNSFLESFLFDANVERAWLREKSNSLEEYCQSLDSEKCDLFSAKNNLSVQLKTTQQELDDLGKSYTDLEENYLRLEKKMAAKIHEVEELQATLNLEKQEHASFIHTSKSQLAHLEGYNQSLEEEVRSRMKDFEDEQDKDVKAQLEIFILLRCIRDMEDRELSLFSEYQKLSETSKSSESLVINLERVNFEQQVKVNSLLDRVEKLRFGIRQLALVLGIDSSYECEVEIEKDQILLQLAMGKIEDLKSSLWTMEDDKHRLLLEKSVFLTVLGQLRLESVSIESARSALDRDLKLRTKDLLSLKSERDILKSASDHLNHQIGMGKVILSQKEMELSETEQKLKAIQSENVEVHSKLKEVSREFVEAEIAREVLEKQILEISQSNTDKDKEIESLLEATQKLDFELNRLHEDIKEQRVKEENLCYELQQKGNEIKLWEHEAETLYLNNQTTDIHAALFKDKVNELVQACESLEQESDSKTEDNEKMKERLHALEDEARGVKSELAAYLPVIVALKGSVTSLEDHLVLQTKNHAANNREIEVADLASHQHDNTNNEENQSLSAVDGFSDLLELQTRIEKIESTVIVQQKLMMQESFDEMMKLEAAMKEIQKLEQVGNERSNLKLYNEEHDYSEVGDEILVKDIPLDQVSHSSSYDHRLVPHAMSRREDAEKNEERLELWETAEHDFDLDLTFHQKKLAAVLTQEKSGSHEIVPEEEKSECPSSEIQSEDVGVVSKRGTTREEGNKKILERLASDARRLTNLQVTVQDLRKKMEQLDKLKNPNDAELNNLKGQLKEVEEAIMYLISTNGKLSKKAAGSPVASDGNASAELDETGKARKSRTSERARRASEKIGRVQLEVQRIQFVLLTLEDRYKIKGSNKVGDRKVLLKDYLYGNLRSPQPNKRKKRLFFSCVKPPVA